MIYLLFTAFDGFPGPAPPPPSGGLRTKRWPGGIFLPAPGPSGASLPSSRQSTWPAAGADPHCIKAGTVRFPGSGRPGTGAEQRAAE